MSFEKNKLKKELGAEGGNVWIAVSIIVAGALVAAAVIFTGNGKTEDSKSPKLKEVDNEPMVENVEIPEVTADDYVFGNVNAPIKIVEYSDTECSYCNLLQGTLHDVIKEYPNDVAWVYRHLPIVSSHPNAKGEAVAAECAGLQGGNDVFWKFLDNIYASKTQGNRLGLSGLEKLAQGENLNIDEFKKCLNGGQFDEKIAKQINDGFAGGAEGTPFSVVIGPSGEQTPVSGALPINIWKQIIDEILEK